MKTSASILGLFILAMVATSSASAWCTGYYSSFSRMSKALKTLRAAAPGAVFEIRIVPASAAGPCPSVGNDDQFTIYQDGVLHLGGNVSGASR